MSVHNFYALVAGWLLGIMFGTSDIVSYSRMPFLVIFSAIFLILLAYALPRLRLSILFLSAVCILGFFYASATVNHFDTVARFTEAVEQEGVAVQVVPLESLRTRVVIRDTVWGASVRAHLTDTSLHVGDLVRYSATLREPTAFLTDTGRVFAYAEYSRARNILFETSDLTYVLVGTDTYYALVRTLYDFRDDIAAVIERSVPLPEAGLAQAMLLGIGGTLDENENRVFREVGLVHIVVLSGFHVMAIFGVMVILAGFVFPYRTRFAVALLATILFSIMVGLTPTVVRAVIMATCVALAYMLGRGRAPLRALAVAACIITFAAPYALLYDAGFQFSFLATFAIVAVVPIVSLFLRAVPTTFGFRGIVAATISVELILTPLISWSMGTFPLIGILANVAVLPVVPFAMLSSLLLWVGSLGDASAVSFLASLTTALHGYIIAVAHIMHALPYAYFTIASFSLSVLGCVYGVIGACIVYLGHRRYGMPVKQKSVLNGHDVSHWRIETIAAVRERLMQKAPEGALEEVVTEDVSR